MKKFTLVLLMSVFLLTGCTGSGIFAPLVNNADGIYDGWVNIYDPGKGFDQSFRGSLMVWSNSYKAVLTDDRGRRYEADHVEYDSWSDELEIFFRVREERWNSPCGHEVLNWEIRMIGNIDFGSFRGDIQSDIDPNDYYSDHCVMDYNPSPEYIGRFDLEKQNDSWY